MYVVCVQVNVVDDKINDFIKATEENAVNTRKEEGCLRFDILQQIDDKCRFTLYEVYKNEEGMAAHKETAHYAKWRDTVAGWMKENRIGIKHHSISPEDEKDW